TSVSSSTISTRSTAVRFTVIISRLLPLSPVSLATRSAPPCRLLLLSAAQRFRAARAGPVRAPDAIPAPRSVARRRPLPPASAPSPGHRADRPLLPFPAPFDAPAAFVPSPH